MEKEEKTVEKQEEIKDLKEIPKEVPMRRIVILTDGSNIKLEEANVSGTLEMTAILQNIINFINQPKKG